MGISLFLYRLCVVYTWLLCIQQEEESGNYAENYSRGGGLCRRIGARFVNSKQKLKYIEFCEAGRIIP